MKKQEIVSYLDEYLKHEKFADMDSSKNGLQVDNETEEIKKIGYAVDVTSYIIDKAVEEKVDMIIAHHGLYRGYETPLTGVMYEKVKKLLDNDIAVYVSHLPLDAHDEVGNNIGLAKGWIRTFGLQEVDIKPAGSYKGETVGFSIRFEKPVDIGGVVSPYCETFSLKNKLYNYGKLETIRSVLFISGHPGAEAAIEAKKEGYDLLVTGEMVHYESTYTKELGQTVLLGGHYETETIGVKLLAHHLEKEFTLSTNFLDETF